MWDALKKVYHFPCPCGDRFEITKLDLRDGEDIARCPSCSLLVRVIFDPVRPAMPPSVAVASCSSGIAQRAMF